MMRLLFCIVLLATITAAKAQSKVNVADFKKLSWLRGKWININPEPGTTAYEKWTVISNRNLRGLGMTMKDGDIVFKENLDLHIEDGFIYYMAVVKENYEPVYFKLTELSDNGFVCENPKHDFPKKISYQREGNILKATISGDGKSIDYVFEKEKNSEQLKSEK